MAGRPQGTLGSKTLQAIGIITAKGCDPLGILCDIAMGSKIQIGATIDEVAYPTLDQRRDAAKELCQYIYPKRKAIEHTGKDGDPIEHRVTQTDAEILAQYLNKPKDKK